MPNPYNHDEPHARDYGFNPLSLMGAKTGPVKTNEDHLICSSPIKTFRECIICGAQDDLQPDAPICMQCTVAEVIS